MLVADEDLEGVDGDFFVAVPDYAAVGEVGGGFADFCSGLRSREGKRCAPVTEK